MCNMFGVQQLPGAFACQCEFVVVVAVLTIMWMYSRCSRERKWQQVLMLMVSFQTVSMAIAGNLSQVEGLLQSNSRMSFSKWL